MQNKHFVSSKNFTKINLKLLNILFFCFPISFLIGNGVTNVIIILICLVGIFAFSKKLYLMKNEKVSLVILAFFLILLISTILDTFIDPKNDHLIKSISYLRYFLLFLVTSYFIKVKEFNFKYFLISSFVCTLFLSLDVTYQFYNGIDILGFNKITYDKTIHLAGLLGDEYIVGGYIQKFSIFSLVLLPFLSNKFENYKFVISIFLISIFFSGILYSGNRMPLVIFIFSIFLIMIFIKDLRFPFSIGILLCSLIFYTTLQKSENLKGHYTSFYHNVKSMPGFFKKDLPKKYPELEIKKGTNFVVESAKDKNLAAKYKFFNFGSGHTVVYLTAIDLWTDNPFLGNGIKSFRIKCLNKLYLPNRVCQSHPHNYYLELLNDSGLIGTLIFLLAILMLIKNKFSEFRFLKKNERLLIICIFVIIFSELMPLRSSGSFFSTQNSAFLFLVLGIINGIKKIKI